MTNAEYLMEQLDNRMIPFMTWVLIADAPDSVFDRWNEALFTTREHEMTQSTWRIILQVEAATQ